MRSGYKGDFAKRCEIAVDSERGIKEREFEIAEREEGLRGLTFLAEQRKRLMGQNRTRVLADAFNKAFSPLQSQGRF